MADFTWSDPDDVAGWGSSSRGCGSIFGKRAVVEFCQLNGLELIARAHQVMMEGYQYHFDGDQLLTIWSAPNYMYRVSNRAAVLKLSADRDRDLVIFEAVPETERRPPGGSVARYFV